MDGKGTLEVPPIAEKPLTIDGCLGERGRFCFKGFGP